MKPTYRLVAVFNGGAATGVTVPLLFHFFFLFLSVILFVLAILSNSLGEFLKISLIAPEIPAFTDEAFQKFLILF